MLVYFEKYRLIFDIIFLLLFAIGFYMRLNQIAYSTVVVVFSLSFLGLSYFFHARHCKQKEDLHQREIFFRIFLLYGIAMSIFGWIFKLQLWQYSKVLLLTGMAGIAIGLMYHFRSFIRAAKEILPLFVRGALVLSITAWFYFLSETQMVSFIYQNDPEFVRLYNQLIENPDNKIYYQQFQNYKDDGKH